jgi:hypothetical protein
MTVKSIVSKKDGCKIGKNVKHNGWGKIKNVSVLTNLTTLTGKKRIEVKNKATGEITKEIVVINKYKNDLYEAAKAGDIKAAQELVDFFLTPNPNPKKIPDQKDREKIKKQNFARVGKILELKKLHPKAILAAIHANEENGRNKIPVILANRIAEIGKFRIEDSIVQISEPFRTKKNHAQRMQKESMVRFDGIVQKGEEYIAIDDAVGMGGTFGAFNKFVKDNNATVVDLVALGQGYTGVNIVMTQEILAKLIMAFDNDANALSKNLEERGLYDGQIQYLSKKEAEELYFDAKRNSISKSGQEGSVKISGVRGQKVGGGIKSGGVDKVKEAEVLAAEILYGEGVVLRS